MESTRSNDERADQGAPRARRTVLTTAAFLIAPWILASAGLFSLLLPFVLASGVIWAATSRRWAAIPLLLAASPLSASFARGLWAYHQTDAYMMSTGLQHSGDTFIDRHTRLPIGTSGCLVDGNEWVRNVPHNLALHLATAVVGPPAGTYGGPLPTASEARTALVQATSLDWRVLAEDRVRIDRRTYPLEDERSHVAVVAVRSGRLLGHFPGAWSLHGFPLPGRDVGPRILDMDYVEGPPAP